MKLLEAVNLTAGYGQVRVLHGISLGVDAGEIAVLLGGNGAGKTTTLRALTGQIASQGSIELDGRDMHGVATHRLCRRGLALVPEGRQVFGDLTVTENLSAGAYGRRRSDFRKEVADWFEIFPNLGNRRNQKAGTLSGGEQQMVAVARALMSNPKVLLLDEPSLGLAPVIVQSLFEKLKDINTHKGTAMLVVEQNATVALGIARYGYVLERGVIGKHGTADELRGDDSIRLAYLGV